MALQGQVPTLVTQESTVTRPRSPSLFLWALPSMMLSSPRSQRSFPLRLELSTTQIVPVWTFGHLYAYLCLRPSFFADIEQNINPFRDPRWGRGQETPGEDSYHLSSYVKALILGLQGDVSDPYKRVVATCKHFAGYDIEDWNGNLRYQNDVQISQQELVEYYLAPFQACVEANVGAFMCSYSKSINRPTKVPMTQKRWLTSVRCTQWRTHMCRSISSPDDSA